MGQHASGSREGTTVKEWMCTLVKHHRDIGRTLELWQRSGLAAAYVSSDGAGVWISYYALFERGCDA